MKSIILLLGLLSALNSVYSNEECTIEEATKVVKAKVNDINDKSAEMVLLRSIFSSTREDGINEYIFIIEGVNLLEIPDKNAFLKGELIHGIMILNKETCKLVKWRGGHSVISLGKMKNIHAIKEEVEK